MPSLLAVAAVAALITSLAVWQGEEPDQPRAAASTTRQSARSSTPPAASGSSSAPAPSSTQSSTAEATPAETTGAEPTPGGPSDMQVVVLNQTSRRGLAGTVADRLREGGWRVPAVGNFRGVVPSTTVYYPPGGEADALAAAADLPVEPRVRPSFGNLSTSRLTVVVTDSYPG